MTVVAKSLTSLSVSSGNPFRWYSLFVGIFLLEIFIHNNNNNNNDDNNSNNSQFNICIILTLFARK